MPWFPARPKAANIVDPVQGVKESYNKDVTDEFIVPFVCVDNRGEPLATIRDDDSCICFQLPRRPRPPDHPRPGPQQRTERARRKRPARRRRSRCRHPSRSRAQKPALRLHDAVRQEVHASGRDSAGSLDNILANVMGQASLRNLRVAETEKYAHVTYFFNGGIEQPFPGEDRVLVPSPKVATYDLKPEMSAAGIADAVIKAVEDGTFDVIIVNFANADMVGHSGKIEPTIKAVETVDACLGRIEPAVRAKGGALLITADHGNAEMMIDPATGGPHTAHTTNPVPFIVVAENGKKFSLKPGGSLRDISPTVLGMLGIPQPKEMTGQDLRVSLTKI